MGLVFASLAAALEPSPGQHLALSGTACRRESGYVLHPHPLHALETHRQTPTHAPTHSIVAKPSVLVGTIAAGKTWQVPYGMSTFSWCSWGAGGKLSLATPLLPVPLPLPSPPPPQLHEQSQRVSGLPSSHGSRVSTGVPGVRELPLSLPPSF